MIWQISIAIIAIAFAVLVFFLIRTLQTVQHSLKDVNETIVQVQKELNDVGVEVKGLIRNSNQITMDLRTKMRTLDSLFGTVENVGDTLEGVTSTIRKASTRFMSNVQDNMQMVEPNPDKKVYKAINWVSSIYDIWQRVKLHRLANSEAARH